MSFDNSWEPKISKMTTFYLSYNNVYGKKHVRDKVCMGRRMFGTASDCDPIYTGGNDVQLVVIHIFAYGSKAAGREKSA